MKNTFDNLSPIVDLTQFENESGNSTSTALANSLDDLPLGQIAQTPLRGDSKGKRKFASKVGVGSENKGVGGPDGDRAGCEPKLLKTIKKEKN